MEGYIEVPLAAPLVEGTMTSVEVEDHELLVALVGGRYYISDARCPHLHGHLAKGVLDGTVVTCPLHHSQFDLSDGHVVRWTDWTGAVLGISELVRHPRPLRTYEVAVEAGRVLVGPEKPPVP
ncbi:MAG: Rieske 2Fe-2S domain-containing protein [Coriobacteriia bacterium]|nr:Rieske 2Fe-2S domain-containing protein [Coriobacteriia bacterium]